MASSKFVDVDLTQKSASSRLADAVSVCTAFQNAGKLAAQMGPSTPQVPPGLTSEQMECWLRGYRSVRPFDEPDASEDSGSSTGIIVVGVLAVLGIGAWALTRKGR